MMPMSSFLQRLQRSIQAKHSPDISTEWYNLNIMPNNTMLLLKFLPVMKLRKKPYLMRLGVTGQERVANVGVGDVFAGLADYAVFFVEGG